jgi:hypothetical protein
VVGWVALGLLGARAALPDHEQELHAVSLLVTRLWIVTISLPAVES